MNRREFNHLLLHGTISSVLPLSIFSKGITHHLPSERRVVLIQLLGGNDGLNTLIPYRNDNYFKYRRNIGLTANERIAIDDQFAFHSALAPLLSTWENSEMSVVNHIGHPYSSRSHFESMDIWNSGQNPAAIEKTGWIGSYLDNATSTNPYSAIQLSSQLSLALKGKRFRGISLNHLYSIRTLNNILHEDQIIDKISGANPTLSFISKHLYDVQQISPIMSRKIKQWRDNIGYPKHPFSYSLKQIADGILSELPTVFYLTQLGGFDTHTNQKKRQEKLFNILSTSIHSFIQVLKTANEWKNTSIIITSEFGRRIQDNASDGSDHGKGSLAIILSGALKKPGLYNNDFQIENLDNGDLEVTIDFRQLYSTILNKWLNNTETVFPLYQPLDLF